MSMIIGKSVDVEAYDKDGNKLENVCRIEKPEIFKKRSKDEAEGDSEKEKKLNKAFSTLKKVGLGVVGVVVVGAAFLAGKMTSSKSSNDESEDLMLTDSTSDSSDTIESAPEEIPNVDTIDVTTVE